MLKTILWDLDGTLLPMNMDIFLKHYFKKISTHVAHLLEPPVALKYIMESTEVMMRDQSPRTNEEVFFDAFSKRVNHLTQQFYDSFVDFYNNEFNDLIAYTEPSPLARPMLEDLGEKGYKLVLATNPIFPEVAIRARMRWAGIEGLQWARVTSYENSRHCKPNLKYYEEILAEVGSVPEECMMVGNSLTDDIVAGQLGIKTFFIKGEYTEDSTGYSYGQSKPGILVKPDYEGKMAELVEYMGGLPSVASQAQPNTP